MTQDNPKHDEILGTLRSILTVISWIGVPALGAMTIIVGALIADHFDQVNLRRDSNWMKPRVQRMWLKEHPEIQADEATQP